VIGLACRSIDINPEPAIHIKEKDMKRIIMLAAVMGSALALQACNQGPDPAKVQADVTKAQADGQKKIADAQADLDKVVAKNNKAMVDTQADAQKDANSANATPADQNKAAADASSDMAKQRADAAKDMADAQYNVDKAKATAAYDVRVAECEGQTGDANKQCKDTAKATYDASVTAADNKRNAAKQQQG